MSTLRVTVAALLVLAVAALAVGWPVGAWIGAGAAWAESHREAAAAAFVGIYVLAAVLAVPGSILTLASGYVFGLPLGVALTSIGSVLGAAAAFGVGRFLARGWVERRVARWPQFRALDSAMHHDGFAILLLARLSPLIPYSLLNYASSITAARLRDYLLATCIGMLPAIVAYVYTGSLAKNVATLTSTHVAAGWPALLALGFAATVALAVLIARRATRALRERLAAEPSLARSGERLAADADPPLPDRAK
ncbi:MAG TPA: TVP38/TMEM64 family protein [Gammaproteobacteria bacterium]|nr:TVP38/TMEM64 family protein [Gammaproteobacteria bacterium]